MRLTDGVIALPLLPLLVVLAAHRPAQARHPGRGGAVGTLLSLYRIVVHRGAGGLDHSGAAGARRDAVAQGARLRARRAGAGRQRRGASCCVHILPNAAASPIIVATTLSVGRMILLESALCFLGLGIQPPVASWGNMLTGAQELLQQAPLLALWPGLLIFLTVIAFNFLGDGLQDALDPRSERR